MIWILNTKIQNYEERSLLKQCFYFLIDFARNENEVVDNNMYEHASQTHNNIDFHTLQGIITWVIA